MNTFKQQCIELRRKDHTLNEIMSMTGRAKTTIYAHIKDIPLSVGKREDIANNSIKLARKVAASRKGKSKRPHKIFTKWSPGHVLLVAHLMFDGETTKSCVYNNRGEALIHRVKYLMQLVYDYEPIYYCNELTQVQHISYHNVALTAFLRKKSTELINKIHTMPKRLQREFLRAFFDDEGCMDYRPRTNIRRIRGYQNSRDILMIAQKLLENFHIESKLQGRNEVVITGKENLKKFQKEINFSKGVRLNPHRKNSIWKKPIEKRELLDMAIKSFKT